MPIYFVTEFDVMLIHLIQSGRAVGLSKKIIPFFLISVFRCGLKTEEQSGGVRKDFRSALEMWKSKLLLSSWNTTGETLSSVLCGHAAAL